MNLFENFDTTELTLRNPPADDSLQTFKELQDLNNIELNKNFVVQKDDIISNFENINKQAGLNFPREDVQKLQDDSSEVIKCLKNYFNRPRPKTVAKNLGMNMENVELKSMKTPSYPSGHSAQSKLIANMLSDEFPQLKFQYQKEANDISDSRNIGRAHFKSDSDFGKEVGDRMYQYLKTNGYAFSKK